MAEAETHLRKGHRLVPDGDRMLSAEFLTMAGRLALATQRIRDAVEALEAACSLVPPDPRPRCWLARVYALNGRREDGLEILEHALAHAPEDDVIREALMNCLNELLSGAIDSGVGSPPTAFGPMPGTSTAADPVRWTRR